jgi:hypothetical protein
MKISTTCGARDQKKDAVRAQSKENNGTRVIFFWKGEAQSPAHTSRR